MTSTIRRLLKNITPLFVLTIVGIVLCLVNIAILLLSKYQGELATGVLAMWALGLYLIFLVDRFLIKMTGLKRVVIIEVVFLTLLPFIYLYLNKDTKIYVDTERPYFIIVYSKHGLTKKQIPSAGLFDHSITFKNDSIINLNYSLLADDNIYVLEPKSWGGYKAKYLDTTINSNKVKIEMRSNNISDEQRDKIFTKLLPTLGFVQVGQTE
jgi:hypothetical protein